MNEILQTIFSGSTLLIAGANAAFFMIIKFNDMIHIEKALKEQKETLNQIYLKVDGQGERISKIEGKCAGIHGS